MAKGRRKHSASAGVARLPKRTRDDLSAADDYSEEASSSSQGEERTNNHQASQTTNWQFPSRLNVLHVYKREKDRENWFKKPNQKRMRA